MQNRIKYAAAGIILCLSLAGCNADRALTLNLEKEPDGVGRGGISGEEQGTGDAADTEEPDMIYVYVCGAVNSPRVVALASGSRGWEAVEAAGGFAEDAAEMSVNLAAKLEDGMQLCIPTQEEADREADAQAAAESGLVNLNKADVSRLTSLPGIGEARAEAIIAYREAHGGFTAIEDIMKVSGIKEGAFEKIKDRITVK